MTAVGPEDGSEISISESSSIKLVVIGGGNKENNPKVLSLLLLRNLTLVFGHFPFLRPQEAESG